MNRPYKILIMGQPGSGKTALAIELAKLLNAVHWNADVVQSNINKKTCFDIQDYIEQARCMGWLCDTVKQAGYNVIADFVCPTDDTRLAFGDCILIYMDTIKDDTNTLFVPPTQYNWKVMEQDAVNMAKMFAEHLNNLHHRQ